MSEIKITKDSLENAILKDGNFVCGYVSSNDGKIEASGYGAHAEGYVDVKINASGNGTHAEGRNTQALANYAHAEGDTTTASGTASHAEGYLTQATNSYAHAEGWKSIASGVHSHAEGRHTLALSSYSHAGGEETIANQEAMTAIGKYNDTSKGAYFVVGNGTSTSSRKDAFVVGTNGNVQIGGTATAKVNNITNVYLGCPIGTVVMWVGTTTPDGWLICNGNYIKIKKNNSGNYAIADSQTILDILFAEGELLALVDVLGSFHLGYAYRNKYLSNLWYDVTGTTLNPVYFSQQILPTPNNFNEEYHIGIPNLQQRFPLGAKDGGKIGQNNKQVIRISGIGTNKYYYTIPELAIGDTIDMLTYATEDYSTKYFKIVGLGDWHTLYYDTILVNPCNKDGKIINEVRLELYNVLNENAAASVNIGGAIHVIVYTLNFSTSLGKIGGESEHTLSIIEMPSHNHSLDTDRNSGSSTVQNPHINSIVTDDTGTNSDIYTNNTGSNAPHNNIPPYLAINFIIKYK